MPIPKFGASKESLEGKKPVPNAVYQVKVDGFEPKLSSKGDSVNMNPVLKIVNHPEHNGARIFFNGNTKAPWILQDFSHCFGLPMEPHPTGENGAEEMHLPGGPAAWKADPTAPEDLSKMKYVGPLLGKVGKIEVLYVQNPGQKPRNEIKQFLCAIDGCATKYPEINHTSDLLKKK